MAIKKQKDCYFCANQLDVDYKDTRTLRRFVNFYMKMLPGSRTGVCAWHQRKLSVAIKRARIMALLSHTHK
ncbi:MAG: 30S ribosomal protein S18 [Patescibacteria group bacterium]|jgi:small subunit ribosomal protein S18|nr:30S ribosomal protein S18 [Patescibacteria group bacterium]